MSTHWATFPIDRPKNLMLFRLPTLICSPRKPSVYLLVMLVLRRDREAHPRVNAALISRCHLVFERKGGAAAGRNKNVLVARRLWDQAAIDDPGALRGGNRIA